MSASATNYKKA